MSRSAWLRVGACVHLAQAVSDGGLPAFHPGTDMASGLRLGFGQFASERSDRVASATSERALVVDDPVAPPPATVPLHEPSPRKSRLCSAPEARSRCARSWCEDFRRVVRTRFRHRLMCVPPEPGGSTRPGSAESRYCGDIGRYDQVQISSQL